RIAAVRVGYIRPLAVRSEADPGRTRYGCCYDGEGAAGNRRERAVAPDCVSGNSIGGSIHHVEEFAVGAECRNGARAGACGIWAPGQRLERTIRLDRESRHLAIAGARDIKMRAVRIDRD